MPADQDRSDDAVDEALGPRLHDARAHVMEAGAEGFIAKPVKLAALQAEVDRLVTAR